MNISKSEIVKVNLTYEYDINEGKGIFYEDDKKKNKIDLSQIWINNAPANCLKEWSADFLPDQHKDAEKKGDGYHLTVEDGLVVTRRLTDKHPPYEKKIKNIKFKIKLSNSNFVSADIPSCCKIIGLKKHIQAQERYKSINLENDGQLYYNSFPLQDEFTIDEYGIKNGDMLEFMTEEDVLNEDDSSREKAIPSSYSSIDGFNNFVYEMRKKIDIVCQIFVDGSSIGTGFMIGDYLIMTNYHVIEDYVDPKKENEITKKIYAKFFYDRKDQELNKMHQEPIIVELDKKIVCWSGSIKKKSVIHGNLDYAILSLKPPKYLNKIAPLKEINDIGEKFFEKAEEDYPINGIKKNAAKRLRANIIEHPQNSIGENDPLKKIAFRENLTYDNHDLELHYKTKTSDGASGSPVINDEGEWIGLHYAKCIKIQVGLFNFQNELCIELGYTLDEELSKDEQKNCFCYKKGEKKEEILYILKQRTRRKVCSNDINNKNGWFSLEELIKKSEKVNSKQYTLEAFIYSFLTRQNVVQFTNDHVGCHTAVEVKAIFKDLNEEINEKKETKLQKKKNAGIDAKKNWEEEENRLEQEKEKIRLEQIRLEQEKKSYWSWAKKHKFKIFVGTGTIIAICFLRSKIQNEAKKLKEYFL